MRITFRLGAAGLDGLGKLLSASLLLCAACTTVQPAKVAQFGQGVDNVKLQFDTTFASVNQMVTEDEIDRAVTLSTLTEDAVFVVLKREDIAKWDKAMSAIDSYVADLTLLLSPDRAKEFGTAVQGLGTEFAKLDPKALPSAGVAAGFAELGRLLIEAKAETDALAAARKADPGMQMIFSAMAAAVGENSSTGIRGTVWEHWKVRLAAQQLSFLKAKGDAAGSRTVVIAYIDLRDKRDAEDLQLGSLHQSLLDLGVAHAALARGSDVDLATAIGMIQQELDATRSLADFFTTLKASAKTKEKAKS